MINYPDSIPRSSLFYTPENTCELHEMIKKLSREEQQVAYQYTMFAFNLAYKLAKDAERERLSQTV